MSTCVLQISVSQNEKAQSTFFSSPDNPKLSKTVAGVLKGSPCPLIQNLSIYPFIQILSRFHPHSISRYGSFQSPLSPNVFTTPITAIGCWQCLPLSVFQLKGKHCRKSHCPNGVVDMFGQGIFPALSHTAIELKLSNKSFSWIKFD